MAWVKAVLNRKHNAALVIAHGGQGVWTQY